jgi:hypothetical protein
MTTNHDQKSNEANNELAKPLELRDGSKLPPIQASVREVQPKHLDGKKPWPLP